MYFKNFPRVILDGSTGATGSSVIAVDILRRVGFNNTGKTGSEFFVEYNVGDTETPESIANHIYGSPEYHWVVLMFNDKFDAFFEWPLSVRKFEKYMTKALNMSDKMYKKVSDHGREHVAKNYNFDNFEKEWVKVMDDFVERNGSWTTRKGYDRWHLMEVA